MKEEQTYRRAIELLRLRRAARSLKPPTTTLIRARLPNGAPTFYGTPHIHGMKEWLRKLGHDEEKLDRLKVIHVAGTKGKGSTCAFIDSFLRSHASRTGFPKKRGLYTSPYLERHNEMIRIDSLPLSDARFAKAFFEVWEGLGLCQEDIGTPKQLQLLAVLSFHVCLQEDVDVAIYECHHGGEYDVTNIIRHPVVTAITSIGLDHEQELGGTIENIAWHKGGIFKQGACALTVPQYPNAVKVLRSRASELGLDLQLVDVSQQLSGDFQDPTQRINASLAKEASDAFIMRHNPHDGLTIDDIEAGIRDFKWPGQFQIVKVNQTTWCLNGAHNPMNASISTKWFRRIPKAEWYGTLCSPAL
ncbi:hypothetical protein BHE90_004892 [Fusarium euwallaceae]|uniref:Mur ligase central domain-containing protein n=2 Tax=Fusarium solani species complex TaxID=232080 RepID=A0A3M2RDQ5_9HYPO|nr:hypothetical protein CDV36_015038 [Fusarium kuroshium]RTE80572.1 hypothetical protein BHE90_004892 [Fusarium euwallaceae]